jgi:hypothetical protein
VHEITRQAWIRPTSEKNDIAQETPEHCLLRQPNARGRFFGEGFWNFLDVQPVKIRIKKIIFDRR